MTFFVWILWFSSHVAPKVNTIARLVHYRYNEFNRSHVILSWDTREGSVRIYHCLWDDLTRSCLYESSPNWPDNILQPLKMDHSYTVLLIINGYYSSNNLTEEHVKYSLVPLRNWNHLSWVNTFFIGISLFYCLSNSRAYTAFCLPNNTLCSPS